MTSTHKIAPLPPQQNRQAMPNLDLSRSLGGRIALVTGAGSGMGRATAKILAHEGARVAVTDINEEAAQKVAEDIRASGGDARAWRLDVSDPKSIGEVVPDMAAKLGGLDILINNAGMSIRRKLDEETTTPRGTRRSPSCSPARSG